MSTEKISFFKFKTPFKSVHFKVTDQQILSVSLSFSNPEDTYIKLRSRKNNLPDTQLQIIMQQRPSNANEFQEAFSQAIHYANTSF